MTASALALVVSAAVLHASWNALAKRSRDQLAFFALASLFAALVLAAPAVWLVARDGFDPGAVPFVGMTVVLHTFYFYALGRAYGSGAYSAVYPMARGLGVALVPVIAVTALGARLPPVGVLGIVLVVAGLTAVHLVPDGGSEAAHRAARPATLGWAAATGAVIACYSLVDKAGVSHLHPAPYLALMEAGTGVCLTGAARRRAGAVAQEWRTRWRSILAVGVMSGIAYLLVLFAFQLSNAAYVVASRELSIVFSAVIGRVWLGEEPLGSRLAAASIILVGVVCVAIAD